MDYTKKHTIFFSPPNILYVSLEDVRCEFCLLYNKKHTYRSKRRNMYDREERKRKRDDVTDVTNVNNDRKKRTTYIYVYIRWKKSDRINTNR
jgi:hypothetical protein